MRRALVLVLAGVVLSTVPMTTVGARIDPCLLTAGDLQEVLGFEFNDDDTFNGLAECEFVSAESADGGATIGIAVSESKTKRDAKAIYKDQRFITPDENEELDGVGNAAFYSAALGDMVVVRTGKIVCTLTLLVFPQEPHRDEAIELAKIAVSNL